MNGSVLPLLVLAVGATVVPVLAVVLAVAVAPAVEPELLAAGVGVALDPVLVDELL